MGAYRHPNQTRLESLSNIFTSASFEGPVLDVEHHTDDPYEILFVRCEGTVCPPEVAQEVGRAGCGLRTKPGSSTETTIVHVVDLE